MVKGSPTRYACRRCAAPWPTTGPAKVAEDAAPLPPLPSKAAVGATARALRASAAAVAQWWLSVLGPPQFSMQNGEAELRMHCHDVLKPHHDTDLFSTLVLLVAALSGRRVWFMGVSDTREVTIQQTVGLSGPGGRRDRPV